MTGLDELLPAWHRVVHTWARAGGTAETTTPAADAVVRTVLDHGPDAVLTGSPALPGAGPVPDPDLALACEVAVVRASGALDEGAYAELTPRRFVGPLDPVRDFCTAGWRATDSPSATFDTWWYLNEHLDPASEAMNPLLHYLLTGRRQGLATLPSPREPQPPFTPDPDRPLRRACLFAGYDADGLVDDHVVSYVRELARFCDVYYLADCEMRPGQLERLADVTRGAWARPHGAYDFGSYRLLATELVGWDALAGYDEVLLVNDSAYLVRPLDEVFATMGARACDWWGLQVTSKTIYGRDRDDQPCPLPDFLEAVPRSTIRYDAFPHVGSYFLALRRPVLDDEGFRRRLGAVAPQRSKIAVIYKYETGTTFYLLGRGFSLSTFLPDVHPYHPVYSPGAFTRIGEGFPLLKRGLLTDNPYATPDLHRWKERVLEHAPGAPVETFEANLLRVAGPARLKRAFAPRTLASGTVRAPVPVPAGRRETDESTPTYSHWWAFPVCAYDHTLAGNERAVFEAVRDDPSIKKIVLTRSRPVRLSGRNVEVVPLHSPLGLRYALRSGVVFVKHAPALNLPFPLSPERHRFVNLWHGIPLKRFGLAAPGTPEQHERLRAVHRTSHAVITSSAIDSLAMAAAFDPLTLADMWPTGLPRNDFVVRAEAELPDDLRGAIERLRAEVDGRRLLLFVPTFKDGQADSYFRFGDAEVARLRQWAERHDAVIGVREHMADRAHTYSEMLTALDPLDLSSARYPDIEVLFRVADALVTDYSSALVDFLLTGRPVISFAYDLERYATTERGLFYDLDEVVPGPVCRDFDAFAEALDVVFDEPSEAQREDYAWRRATFFDHLDDHNARRVVRRVKQMFTPQPGQG